MFIATLIAEGQLDAELLSEVIWQFDEDCTAGKIRERHWLDEGAACDLHINPSKQFSFDDRNELAEGIKSMAIAIAKGGFGYDLRIDVIIQPEGNRLPQLFIADMDSTMIGQECIDELGDMAGVGEQVAAITERAMQGELDFAGSLKERLALLEGLPVGTISRLLEERIVPNPGAERLVKTLKAKGVRCVLVSGGFTAFADVVGGWLGFDRVVANTLGIDGDRLTGTVDGDIVDRATKARVLREEIAALGEGVSLAIGDGANDLDMLDAASLGIAYRAKPAVAAAADARLDHHPLDAVLWALGLPQAEWA